MKKILSLVFGLILLLSSGCLLYVIGSSCFIDYDDINNFEEMFENQDEVLRVDTIDGITYTSKIIVNNYKYKVVGTKSFKEISISIYSKQTKKLDIYGKDLLLKNNNIFFKKVQLI